MELTKSDIPALNFIIDRVLDSDFSVYSDDLVKEGFISGANRNEVESEFESILSILKMYGCVKVTDARNEVHGASVDKNGFTSKFKKDGGFNKVLNDLQNEIVRKDRALQKEQLETELAKSNIEANKLNAKIAKQNSQNESKNRIAMWVNISVGVLNTVLLAIQIWLIVRK